MSEETYAFKMQLNEGQVNEYQRRHDDIWPELSAALRDVGVVDYSIHFDADTHILFAVMRRRVDHGLDALSETALMQKWWDFMADIMATSPDNQPVVVPLRTVFEL